MPLIGEAVVDGNARIVAELFDHLLREAAVFDRVVHLAEHAGGVLDAFLVADLRGRGIKEGRAGALVVSSNLKGAARAGGGLFEDERNVLADKSARFRPHALGLLEVDGEINEIVDLSRRVVNETEKAAAAKIHRHGMLQE